MITGANVITLCNFRIASRIHRRKIRQEDHDFDRADFHDLVDCSDVFYSERNPVNPINQIADIGSCAGDRCDTDAVRHRLGFDQH